MRFFTVIDFQHLVLSFFLGLAGAVVIYLSFRYGTNRNTGEEIDPTTGEYPKEDGKETMIPPVLAFLYVGVVVCIILYVVFFFTVFGAGPF